MLFRFTAKRPINRTRFSILTRSMENFDLRCSFILESLIVNWHIEGGSQDFYELQNCFLKLSPQFDLNYSESSSFERWAFLQLFPLCLFWRSFLTKKFNLPSNQIFLRLDQKIRKLQSVFVNAIENDMSSVICEICKISPYFQSKQKPTN